VSTIRDQILASLDIPSQKVDVPEWGVDGVPLSLEVRGMTGRERTRMMEMATTDGEMNLTQIYPQIIIATCFDPATNLQVFEEGDAMALLTKSAVAIDRVAKVGMELSGFTEKAAEKAGKDSSLAVTSVSPTN
jgi:hypothetical protein